jgi:NAD(P)-dependent dehydrogenase (short-subunit alcohol dehydrogenase family)
MLPADRKSATLSIMVALVTGGGRGIGQGVALRLAREGWTVGITGRTVADLQATARQSEGRIQSVPADVADPESVRQMVQRVEQELGPIDLLVNNAGTGGPVGPFWENDPDDWWRCQEVNVRGPMLSCHHALPRMMARKRGCIVNVASAGGCQAISDLSAYVTSKTALIRFSEQLADELRPYGVTVFAIHPGAVRTAMVETARHKVPLVQAMLDAYEVTPDAAADLILFLASGRGNALSGHFLSVGEDIDRIAARASEVREKMLYSLRLRSLED